MAQKKNRTLTWIVLGLCAIGLVGFGGANLTGQARTLGRVGEKDIPIALYANALRGQINAFSQSLGVPLTFAQAQAFGLDRAVLGQIVAERVRDNEAARLGLSVGDLRVAETIRSLAAFQGPAGFDRALYGERLAREGLTEGAFEAQVRDDLARTLIDRAILAGLPAPEQQADLLLRWSAERRSFAWARLGPEAVDADPGLPEEAQLRAVWEANPAAFTAPEQRDITYAWLTPSAMLDRVTVDEAAVRALYEERIADYVLPERRLVERLVYPDAAAAEAAMARLAAGEADFEALVAERGLRLESVDLGDVTREGLGPAGEAVFAAATGEVVGPLDSELGPALFRVNAVLAAQETAFEEVAEELRAELADQRARRILADSTEGIADLIAGGASVEEIAERAGLELGTIRWSEGMTEGIAAYDAFRDGAAAAVEGAVPTFGSFDDGGVFVLRLDGIVPPALRPFEEARADVEALWRAEATAARVRAEAEARAEAIRAGGGFAAAGAGLVPLVETAVLRRDFIPDAPQDLVAQVFEMAEGEVRVIPDGTAAVIVRLEAVAPPDPTDPAVIAERADLLRQVAEGQGRDLLDAVTGTLQAGTEIAIDETVLQAVNAQLQ